MARPAAEVTACCSAMPTSKQRSGKGLGEPVQPGGIEHRGGDRDHPLVDAAEAEQFLGEHVGPGLSAHRAQRGAGRRVDLADRVEAILLVVLGGLEAVALAGQAVHQHRAAELLGLVQRPLHRGDVVAVDRADVLHAQIREHALRGEHVLQADLDPVQQVVRGAADQRRAADIALDHVEDLLVLRVGAQPGQVLGQAADRRGVGAAVVVDQDDQRQVGAAGDVVQRLPGHAAGQRAVADEGDHGAGSALLANGLGQAVGVGQRGRRVRVLHPVVLGLGSARIPRQAVSLPQRAEPVLSPGQDLVHVALVAGVEDDRIASVSRRPDGGRWSARPRRGSARGGRRSG